MTAEHRAQLERRRTTVKANLERANGEWAMELESELVWLNNVLKEV